MKTEEKSASNKKLISLCVIERALEGDIQAINKVLKHYEGYIAKYQLEKCMTNMEVFIIVWMKRFADAWKQN